jgi:glutamate N-acetyltransferase/amino-acid N-acetyltransferase
MQPVKLPKGFRAAGVAAGIKKGGGLDLALLVSDRDCVAAAVFTQNKVKAAPVIYDQQLLAEGNALRAVVINSGCANACTGERGLRDCAEMAELVAQQIGCPSNTVFVMSTGVIGVPLPMDKLRAGIPAAAQTLSEDGLLAAAQAIMTTDTLPKLAAGDLTVMADEQRSGPRTAQLAGIAKGAGMIHPNMATMLAVVMTDAVVRPEVLKRALNSAVRKSFNRISVDGDTSTNDTLVVLANGASELEPLETEFEILLTSVCTDLAKQIVKDGEGATKFITIEVTGARDERMAEQVGRTIARSPLVKTAFYGEDPNWGRIIAAVGYSGEDVFARSHSAVDRRRAGLRRRRSRGLPGRGGHRRDAREGDRHPARLGPEQRQRYGVDVRSLPRLRDDQRPLPHLSRCATNGLIKGTHHHVGGRHHQSLPHILRLNHPHAPFTEPPDRCADDGMGEQWFVERERHRHRLTKADHLGSDGEGQVVGDAAGQFIQRIKVTWRKQHRPRRWARQDARVEIRLDQVIVGDAAQVVRAD